MGAPLVIEGEGWAWPPWSSRGRDGLGPLGHQGGGMGVAALGHQGRGMGLGRLVIKGEGFAIVSLRPRSVH